MVPASGEQKIEDFMITSLDKFITVPVQGRAQGRPSVNGGPLSDSKTVYELGRSTPPNNGPADAASAA
ncbi:hypothetical protein EVAR_26853_1 [Eumeta japonica]|uniref:Uncharacterized protein n=1 Tax=Eumeta variegata TaxID=151549 RepID=A0A4C1VVI5_EUMVA|nr:hypothetical protein EVAR_26853_1 [Eumeta japonica]